MYVDVKFAIIEFNTDMYSMYIELGKYYSLLRSPFSSPF